MNAFDSVMNGYWGNAQPAAVQQKQEQYDGLLSEGSGFDFGMAPIKSSHQQEEEAAMRALLSMYLFRSGSSYRGGSGSSSGPGASRNYDFSQVSFNNHGSDPAVIQRALQFVGKWEGGLSNDPDDRGGLTNFGITQATYNSYQRSRGQSGGSVANISRQDAQNILLQNYYYEVGAHRMSEPWAIAMFDTAVNMGPGRARELYRQSGGDLAKFFELRESKYRQFASNGNQGKFLNGWMNRLNDLERTVLA